MTTTRLRSAITWRALSAAMAIAAALTFSGPGIVRADETQQFDIAAQPLVRALKAFAAQSSMQLLYKHDAVEGITANAVVGTYEKRMALERLLLGTGLEVVFSASDAATIRPKAGRGASEDVASSDP